MDTIPQLQDAPLLLSIALFFPLITFLSSIYVSYSDHRLAFHPGAEDDLSTLTRQRQQTSEHPRNRRAYTPRNPPANSGASEKPAGR